MRDLTPSSQGEAEAGGDLGRGGESLHPRRKHVPCRLVPRQPARNAAARLHAHGGSAGDRQAGCRQLPAPADRAQVAGTRAALCVLCATSRRHRVPAPVRPPAGTARPTRRRART